MDVLLTRSYKIIKFQKSIETLFKRKLQTNVTSIESVKSFDSIPGPKPIPIFGNMWHYFPLIGTYYGLAQHEINIRQYIEFGDIVRLKKLKVRPDLVLCFNPKDVEMIYRNDGPTPQREFLESVAYHRLKMRNELFQGFAGIFASEGEEWQNARSIINSIMMQRRNVQYYIKPIEQVADSFIEKIRRLSKIKPDNIMPDDFEMEISRWALESVGYVTLHKKFGLLNPNPDMKDTDMIEVEEYLKNLIVFLDLLYKVDVEPNPWKYISNPTWRKYVKASDEVLRFIRKQIDTAIITMQKENTSFGILYQIIKNNPRYAYATVMDIISAGVDTTTKSVSCLLYYVSTNKEVQDRLRTEIKSVKLNNETCMAKRLENMPYLRAVVKESLRIAPVGLGIARKTCVDLILSGYHIPKGTDVMICNLAMSRNDQYFYEPNKFIPERWLKDSKKNVNPWVYLPFGYGVRSCIGRRLAIMEMEVLLYKVIENFQLHWPNEEMKFKMLLTYGCADPLRIQVKPLQESEHI